MRAGEWYRSQHGPVGAWPGFPDTLVVIMTGDLLGVRYGLADLIRRLVVAGASDADDEVAALGVGVDDALGLCAHPMT